MGIPDASTARPAARLRGLSGYWGVQQGAVDVAKNGLETGHGLVLGKWDFYFREGERFGVER